MQNKKLLATGDGGYMKIVYAVSGFYLLVGIAGIAYGVNIKDSIKWYNRDEFLETLAPIIIVFGILFCFVAVFNFFRTLLITQTNIFVYEDMVTGSGMTGLLSAPQSFNITISDVRNVDVQKNTAIFLHTQYGKYTCYMKNAAEVQGKIMELVNAQRTLQA